MTNTTTDSASPAPDPDQQQPETAMPAPDETVTPPPTRRMRTGSSPIAWVVALGLAAMVGTLLFVGGYLAAGGASGSCVAPSEAFAPFCDAYAKLKAQYVDQLDDTKLAEGAIQGMFEHGVQDPFSGYMSPDDYQRALGDLSGQFSGIGAEMASATWTTPTTWRPARASARPAPWWWWRRFRTHRPRRPVKAGDIMTAINGKSVNGLALEDAIKQVRGEAGTQVTLSLLRDDRPLEMTITRANITTREVTSRMLDNHIAYIALHGFSNPSSTQFHDAVAGLLDRAPPASSSTSATTPAATSTRPRRSRRSSSDAAWSSPGVVRGRHEALGGDRRRPGHRHQPPPGVLVNGGSASASEIVSAALKETRSGDHHRRATYGKNTVQVWDPLEMRRRADHDLPLVHPRPQQRGPGRRAAGHRGQRARRNPGGSRPLPGAGVQFLTHRALGEDGNHPRPPHPTPAPPAWSPPPRRSAMTPLARWSRRSISRTLRAAAQGC